MGPDSNPDRERLEVAADLVKQRALAIQARVARHNEQMLPPTSPERADQTSEKLVDSETTANALFALEVIDEQARAARHQAAQAAAEAQRAGAAESASDAGDGRREARYLHYEEFPRELVDKHSDAALDGIRDARKRREEDDLLMETVRRGLPRPRPASEREAIIRAQDDAAEQG